MVSPLSATTNTENNYWVKLTNVHASITHAASPHAAIEVQKGRRRNSAETAKATGGPLLFLHFF